MLRPTNSSGDVVDIISFFESDITVFEQGGCVGFELAVRVPVSIPNADDVAEFVIRGCVGQNKGLRLCSNLAWQKEIPPVRQLMIDQLDENLGIIPIRVLRKQALQVNFTLGGEGDP
jgi:hypothetical protein